MKKPIFLLLIAVAILSASSSANAESKTKKTVDNNFEISKNLDIYNSLFRELEVFYVDSIKTEKMVRESIDDMLSSLDPYTTYIPEEEEKDFKFMTTGEYGGVGAIISQDKEKNIIISEPYENMPAEKIGLKAGDILRQVDGVKLKDKTTTDVSNMLRGQPGSEVKIVIERPGDKKEIKKSIIRQKILIPPVSYYGMVSDKIGYILLNQFTDKAANDVKAAIFDLKNNHHMESLVLDLRNNPGGLLDQAVSIINFFVPEGQEVLSTKGKLKQWDVTYKTTEEPILPDMPVIVLVNGSTASASEIVSGAMQDLDRGVVIGTRTFGKGLVQATREVSYNGHLKLTTAKYYTPSGRCIQAIDYSHRADDGTLSKVPDSLMHEFKTKGGRTVKDGGGIMPDIEVKNEQKMNISYYLYNQNMIFDYATQYCIKNKKIAEPENFSITNQDYEDFKNFIKEKKFTYKLKSADNLKKLKEIADFEGYADLAKPEFDALEKKLTGDIDRDLKLFKKDVVKMINEEIIKRNYYQKGVIRYTLQDDPELKKAIEVLNDKSQYDSILKPKK